MYTYKGAKYSLEIDGSRAGVILDGCTVAELDIATGVDTLDENYETADDADTCLPVLESVKEDGHTVTFRWTSKSNLWEEKIYTLVCDPLRFKYSVTVKGKGKVDGVLYFSGCSADGNRLSGYEFQDGFTPCLSLFNEEDYHFRAMLGCHRWSVLMVPPMFCYAFRTEGLKRQLGIGLVAEKGEHNFQSFDFNSHGGIWFSTDQHGHTEVDGEWTAPFIIGFGAEDEYDVCEKYSKYYYTSGIARPRKKEIPPKFWYGPMACGWIEQFARADVPGGALGRSCERVYRDYLDRLHAGGLYPRCLIIDDKWQSEYAVDAADPEKWPDLRAFVDEQHENCVHTMLWFKVFDPEGLSDDACVTADMGGGKLDPPAKKIDPSSPAFLKVLDDALYRIFSSDEGCYDCDGIKIDYAFMNPIGRKFKTYSGKYGVELLYDYMEHIYTVAKKIKPHAIINASACHPYFAHLVDQARLHDYDGKNRFCREDLMFRAKMYKIATPDSIIDTDNGGYNTKRDTMRCMLEQSEYGVPDIYGVSPFPSMTFTDEDFAALSQVWKEYTDRIDAMYEGIEE